MSIGRNFAQALQKALRSIERSGVGVRLAGERPPARGVAGRSRPSSRRPVAEGPTGVVARCQRRAALRDHRDRSVVPRADRRHQRDGRPDPGRRSVVPELLRRAKQTGFSDAQIAGLRGARGRDSRRAARAGDPPGVQDRRHLRRGVSAYTPYHYSSYDAQTEVEPRDRKRR